MPLDEEITFVNRTEELDVLLSRVYPFSKQNTVTFIRSPSGFGKTSLTDRLIEKLGTDGPLCVVVDPSIRSKSRSDRIYAWFFVQRAAEFSSLRIKASQTAPLTFAQFIRRKKYSRLNWKHVYENLKEILSLSKVSRFAIETAENLLKVGKYSPDLLLQDDGAYATQLAQEYVDSLPKVGPTLFVIRECQNIDPESFRFFLTLGERVSNLSVILEYTANEPRFAREHEKIILDTITDKSSMNIFDLLRLNIKEFRHLLRQHVSTDQKILATAELNWDGSLRIVKELKFSLMTWSVADMKGQLLLPSILKKNLGLLSKRKKLILAFIASNIEAIRFQTLLAVMKRVEPKLSEKKLRSELEHLSNNEKYLRVDKQIALADEDVNEALTTSTRIKPLMLLAETRLRDFYLDVVEGKTYSGIPLPNALRHALALCSRTGDLVALQRLIETLDSSVIKSSDQTLYINIVAGAILNLDNFSFAEHHSIVRWASKTAYEVGDYPTAAALLETLSELDPFEKAMLACCYGEMNRHAESLELAEILEEQSSGDSEADLVAKLIECAGLYALGSKRESLEVHQLLRFSSTFIDSPLFGFVLRYTEIVRDFPNCLDDVLKSTEIFKSRKLLKSAAYSQLAGAMHLAYLGETKKAQDLINDAETTLIPHVRDRQILLNNSVVVELLSKKPDVSGSLEKLNTALFTVRDEFSRLTLHNNRLICFWLQHDLQQALHCVSIIESILRSPDFGNRDIFWTVCFNVCSFLEENDEGSLSEKFKVFLENLDLDDCCYKDYWKVRYGIEGKAQPEFDFLLKFKYHPEYLSHWIIDLDGLSRLKAEAEQ